MTIGGRPAARHPPSCAAATTSAGRAVAVELRTLDVPLVQQPAQRVVAPEHGTPAKTRSRNRLQVEHDEACVEGQMHVAVLLLDRSAGGAEGAHRDAVEPNSITSAPDSGWLMRSERPLKTSDPTPFSTAVDRHTRRSLAWEREPPAARRRREDSWTRSRAAGASATTNVPSAVRDRTRRGEGSAPLCPIWTISARRTVAAATLNTACARRSKTSNDRPPPAGS